jgi:hypothetical protein
MRSLGIRTKLLFSVAIFLFIMFVAGESDAGQRLLRGQPSENSTTYEDQYAGGRIVPFIYCAVPSGVLLLLSFISYTADKRRVN